MVLTCLPVIYKDFCAENVPDFFFPLSAFHALLQHATCLLHNISLELCQRHCQILMLRINLGLTWPFTMVARLHGMADLDSLHIASTPPV